MASAAYLRHYPHFVCGILVVCSRQPRGDLTRAVNIGSVESQLLYPSAVYCLRPNTLPDYSCRVGPGPQNAYSNNPFKSRKNSRSPECLALGTGTSSLTGPTDVTCREIPSAGHPPASTPPRPSCLRLPSAPPPALRRLRPPLRRGRPPPAIHRLRLRRGRPPPALPAHTPRSLDQSVTTCFRRVIVLPDALRI